LIDSKSGINAFLGIYAELGIASAAGVGTIDSSSTSAIELIDFSAQGASDYGYNSFEQIPFLPFEGSGSDGLDVFQIDAAKRPALEDIKTYAVTGTDTSSPNQLAVNGQGVLVESDDMVSSDNATGLPLNNFIWTVEFTALDNPSVAYVASSFVSGTTDNFSILRGFGGWSAGGTGLGNVTTDPVADVSNRRWIAKITKATSGMTLDVFEKDITLTKNNPLNTGDVVWGDGVNYGSNNAGQFKMDMILHRETISSLDGSIVYLNFDLESISLPSGGYNSIGSTVNNFTLTNQNPSGKTFDVYSLTASELLIAFDQGDQLSNVTVPAGNFYGAVVVVDVAYNANDLGSNEQVISYLGSVRLASEDGSGHLDISLASVDEDIITTTVVFDGQRRIIAGGVGGDGINTFGQVSVDGVIEDFSQNPSAFWPASLVPFTPENRQDLYAYKLVLLTEPVTSQEQLDRSHRKSSWIT